MLSTLAGLLLFTAQPPPVLSLVELEVYSTRGRVTVQVAHPKGWTGDYEADGQSIRLFGPEGEGEMLIAVATHGDELGQHLKGLSKRHPQSQPSPPRTMEVPGINPDNGERATQFVITGREAGELVMIERKGLIVLFGTVVEASAWPELKKQLDACYPSVQVSQPKPIPKRNRIR